MDEPEKRIPLHGGCRKLKSFQVAQLGYDVAVLFCERYIEKRSRTLAALRDTPLPKLVLSELLIMNRNEKAMPFEAISFAHENEPQ